MRNIVKTFIVIDLVILLTCCYSLYKSYRIGPTVYDPRVVLLYSETAMCTGFIVGRGLIATAGHCIDFNDKETIVRFIDGHEKTYKVMSLSRPLHDPDCAHDWALVMADTGSRPFFALSGEPMKPGASIRHIGHPHGFERELEADEYFMGEFEEGLFITGYAIPGESGSPIVNNQGEVVGILTCSKVNVPVAIGTFITPLKNLLKIIDKNMGPINDRAGK